MSQQIEQTEITDLKTFKWGESWRALSISKEQRMDKDYYFARIVKFYGKEHNTYEYDIGNTAKEFAWLGRKTKYVGTSGPDKDPESKTFGQRKLFPAETEIIDVIDSDGNKKKKTVLVKGRIIYEFTLPVNEENTKKIKSLIGPLTVNKSTTFQIISGNEPPVGTTQEVFFKSNVSEIMTLHMNQLSLLKKNDKPT